MSYLRDPSAIYEQSFATIRAEADLSRLPAELHPVSHPDDSRMRHDRPRGRRGRRSRGGRCGSQGACGGMPVLCDCEMARSGIIAKNLHGNELVVTLNDPAVPDLARELTTTRSAAAVELWRDRLHGAVVVIGNAPTALFHLLDALASGAPAPAAIIAAPVGFVGAAESKARLIAEAPVPYVTVSGRRGGSAIASAAFNAIAGASA
jgi:precorrin-8X/cobalt-precorrin-8 methylmutase